MVGRRKAFRESSSPSIQILQNLRSSPSSARRCHLLPGGSALVAEWPRDQCDNYCGMAGSPWISLRHRLPAAQFLHVHVHLLRHPCHHVALPVPQLLQGPSENSVLDWCVHMLQEGFPGAVIILGMVEKAVFYSEYATMNNSGESVEGLIEVGRENTHNFSSPKSSQP